MEIKLPDLERAINYWRAQKPSTGEERRLSPEVNQLARLYALMIFNGTSLLPASEIDAGSAALIAQWRDQQS